MKTTTKLLGAATLACTALFATARAQSDAATPAAPPSPSAAAAPAAPAETRTSDAWVLGRGYAQLDGSIEKFRDVPQSSTGAIPDLALNLPVNDNLDYGLSYAYEHAANPSFHLNENTFETGLTGYTKMGFAAPFLNADLGYGWERSSSDGVARRFDHPLYSLGGGVEVPLSKRVSLRPAIDYLGSLGKPHQGDATYGLSANSWLNDVFATFIGADWKTGYSGARSSVVYTAGVRISFDSP
jgi:hypothetical protein